MGRLLLLPAGTEAVTAAALVWVRPPGVGLVGVLLAGGLLACIWVITALVQVPLHSQIHRGYDAVVVRQLVGSNRVRTVLWTARGAIIAALLAP